MKGFSEKILILFLALCLAVPVIGSAAGCADKTASAEYNVFDAKGLLAAANGDGLFGYIDKNGNEVIPCAYSDARPFSPSGLAAVKERNGKWGYINEKGEAVVSPSFESAGDFDAKGNAVVQTSDGNYGVINSKGQFTVDAVYASIRGFGKYDCAVAGISGKEFFLIDRNGKQICGPYAEITFSENGFAFVTDYEGKHGMTDLKGNVKIAFEYDDISDAADGLFRVRKENGYGLVKENGASVIPALCDSIGEFGDAGIASVTINVHLGYVDSNGKYILSPTDTLKTAFGFASNGIARVLTSDGVYRFLKSDGTYASDASYKNAADFDGVSGLAPVSVDGKLWGAVNAAGETVFECEYTKLTVINGFVFVLDGKVPYGRVFTADGKKLGACPASEVTSPRFADGGKSIVILTDEDDFANGIINPVAFDRSGNAVFRLPEGLVRISASLVLSDDGYAVIADGIFSRDGKKILDVSDYPYFYPQYSFNEN